MSTHNINSNSYADYQQFDEDFESYGYKVKNVKRSGKKKVNKFKDYREENTQDSLKLAQGHGQLTKWTFLFQFVTQSDFVNP